MAKAKSAGTTMTARELVRNYIERLHTLLGFKLGFFARQAMVPFGERDDPPLERSELRMELWDLTTILHNADALRRWGVHPSALH